MKSTFSIENPDTRISPFTGMGRTHWLAAGHWFLEGIFSHVTSRENRSGNLLQFVECEDFLENGLPSLRFYGQFEPVIQFYSCAESPMWMHLTFLSSLSQPADAPFWTAVENEGDWETEGRRTPTMLMPGAGIRLLNYTATGETEIETGKVEVADSLYQHLAFHSRYPVEELDPANGMAMHYAWISPLFFKGSREFHGPFRNDWLGEEDGVLYRRLQMSDSINGTYPCIDLAGMVTKYGVLRADRARTFQGEQMRLCHYALPHIEGTPCVERRKSGGWQAVIASSRTDSAMIIFTGWQELGRFVHDDFHPRNVPSTVIFAEPIFDSPYPDNGQPFPATLLHRTDGKSWSDDQYRRTWPPNHSLQSNRRHVMQKRNTIKHGLVKDSGRGRRAFTLVEMLTAVAIVAILAVLITSSLGIVREKAKDAGCLQNLRQIATLASMYMADNDGYAPYWRTWTDGSGSWTWDNYALSDTTGGEMPRMAGYHTNGLMTQAQFDAPGSKHIFNCPANNSKIRSKGYSANQLVMGDVTMPQYRRKLISIPNRSKIIMIGDNPIGKDNEVNIRWFANGNWKTNLGFKFRHNKRAHLLFCDFHIESKTLNELTDANVDPNLN